MPYPSNRYELKLGLDLLDLDALDYGQRRAPGAQSFHQYAARIGAKYTVSVGVIHVMYGKHPL